MNFAPISPFPASPNAANAAPRIAPLANRLMPASYILNAENLDATTDFAHIFNLGAPRTGTTSTHLYLEQCGFKAIHYFADEAGLDACTNDQERRAAFRSYVANCGITGFADHPMRIMWQAAVEDFPKARFILSLRGTTQIWADSAWRYFAALKGQHDLYEALIAYIATNNLILDHFQRTGLPLLVLNIDADPRANAELLRAFLGKPHGPGEMPNANSHNETPELARPTGSDAGARPCIADSIANPGPRMAEVLPDPLSRRLTDMALRPITRPGAAFLTDRRYVIIPSPGVFEDRLADALKAAGLGFAQRILHPDFWHKCQLEMPGLTEVEFRYWAYRQYRGISPICGGCFGAIADIYQLIHQRQNAPYLTPLLGEPTYVVLTRRDLVAQACNAYVCEATGWWQAPCGKPDDPRPAVPFDGLQIKLALHEILHQQWLTHGWLAEKGAVPLVLWAEDVVDNPVDAAGIVAQRLALGERQMPPALAGTALQPPTKGNLAKGNLAKGNLAKGSLAERSLAKPHHLASPAQYADWPAALCELYPWLDELLALSPIWPIE